MSETRNFELAFENWTELSAPSSLWRVSYMDRRVQGKPIRSVSWFISWEEADQHATKMRQRIVTSDVTIQEFVEVPF